MFKHEVSSRSTLDMLTCVLVLCFLFCSSLLFIACWPPLWSSGPSVQVCEELRRRGSPFVSVLMFFSTCVVLPFSLDSPCSHCVVSGDGCALCVACWVVLCSWSTSKWTELGVVSVCTVMPTFKVVSSGLRTSVFSFFVWERSAVCPHMCASFLCLEMCRFLVSK